MRILIYKQKKDRTDQTKNKRKETQKKRLFYLIFNSISVCSQKKIKTKVNSHTQHVIVTKLNQI